MLNKEYCKEYHKKHREKILQGKREEYKKNKENKIQYYKENKEQILEKCKKYKNDNKEIIKNKNKTYYDNNTEKIKIVAHKYYENNKEKIKKSNDNYKKNRYKKDIKFRLERCVSSSLNKYLKNNNLSKGGRHWEDLVGYTVCELKTHLESLFVKGMTWENYGAWHIDHILPKSFFRYKSTNDVEFKYCWSLINLQPLWAKDNLKKSDKLDY